MKKSLQLLVVPALLATAFAAQAQTAGSCCCAPVPPPSRPTFQWRPDRPQPGWDPRQTSAVPLASPVA